MPMLVAIMGPVASVLLARSASRICRPAGDSDGVFTGHQNRELVSAEASHHLSVVEQGRHRTRQCHQHRVASSVAKQIVDLLEAIEIEAEDPKLATCRAGLLQLQLETLGEARAICQACEGIMMSKEVDLPLRPTPSAQIPDCHGVMRLITVGHRPHDQFNRNLPAIREP